MGGCGCVKIWVVFPFTTLQLPATRPHARDNVLVGHCHSADQYTARLVLPQKSSFRVGRAVVRARLDRGKTWEGALNCRRKTGDTVPLDTTAIPVSFTNKGWVGSLIWETWGFFVITSCTVIYYMMFCCC